MARLTSSPAWEALTHHAHEMQDVHLRDLFAEDHERAHRFTERCGPLTVDFSKNRLTATTIEHLLNLARYAELDAWRERMFAGDKINTTEGRSVLHVALRNRSNRPIYVGGADVMPEVNQVLTRLRAFVEQVRDGTWLGHNGEAITDVVNIGIGGSDLGPYMVCEALHPYQRPDLRAHFVSNVDPAHLVRTLRPLDPGRTLFIVASKTFTTQETMTNASSARAWLLEAFGGDAAAIPKHFVAVSTNAAAVDAFGIDTANMFGFWDWVGGRYSLWSAIGLPIALAIGFERFEQLLGGAHEMDEHFRTAEFANNLPVLLGLIGVWYRDFLRFPAQAILPYDQNLHRLPAYLQQADMESNGKRVSHDGSAVDCPTGPIIWGEPGTNGQHAFYQLLHQGTDIVPVDFLTAAVNQTPLSDHHAKLLANCLAQAEALMRGKTLAEATAELEAQGLDGAEVAALAPHKVFPGNRPSTTILYPKLTPHVLGMLIALYEHKIFAQGVIWGVNSFDQWGVELGKQLAKEILPMLDGTEPAAGRDSSTLGLIGALRRMQAEAVEG